MFSMNEILGIIAIILGIIGVVPYIKSIISGQTKPHIFTWFIWGLLTAIAFFAQWSEGAGTGAWVTGMSAAACITIFFMALKNNEHNITKSDTVTFTVALLILPLWYYTGNALYAIILVTIIDSLGFYPTFRKSYSKPYEEHFLLYTTGAIKFFISLFIMDSFNLTTTLYPISLVVLNTLFVIMLYWRRNIIRED